MPGLPALLLLADGRFPAGAHAHSAGVEAAVADGRVFDLPSLKAFAEGRLRTVGLVEAALAMATVTQLAHLPDAGASRRLLADLDAEADARIPAPALRAASRRLGRQLLRTAARCWPSPLLAPATDGSDDPHQCVAFGLVAVAAEINPLDVGHLTAHHTLTTPMQAGVRLLGLDPFAVAAACADLADVAGSVVAEAARLAAGPLEALPARSATLVDLAAVEHAAADGRLFAT